MIGQLLGFFHCVCGQQDRCARVAQLVDEIPHVAPGRGIQAGGGLVQHQQRRAPHQGAGELDPLLLAAAHAAERGAAQGSEAQPVHQFGYVPGVAVEPGHMRDGLMGVRARRDPAALQHDPDLCALFGGASPGVVAQDLDRATVRPLQARADLDGGGLTGPVGAEQAGHATPGNLELQTGQGLGVPEAFAHVGERDRGGWGSHQHSVCATGRNGCAPSGGVPASEAEPAWDGALRSRIGNGRQCGASTEALVDELMTKTHNTVGGQNEEADGRNRARSHSDDIHRRLQQQQYSPSGVRQPCGRIADGIGVRDGRRHGRRGSCRQPRLQHARGSGQAAGLAETLSAEGPYTVFAPTNEAFEALPAGHCRGIAEAGQQGGPDQDPDLPRGGRARRSCPLTSRPARCKTVEGEKLDITTDGGVKVNGVTVVTADVEASNGVIHAIDGVLIPPDVDPAALK